MKLVPNSVSRTVSTTALKLQHKSPGLLLGAGIAGVVTSAVLASRATLRLDALLAETQATNDKINNVPIGATNAAGEVYTEQDKVDKAVVKLKLILEIGKLYGPAIVVGTASIAMLVGSHQIMNRRNSSLVAAYAALDKSFRAYRNRVVEDFGTERDREYANGYETERVTEVDPKTGRKVSRDVKHSLGQSPYAVLIDQNNPNVRKNNPASTITFLRLVESYANERLQSKGFVLLNDVYAELGVDRTSAGSQVGWVYNAARDADSDGYISFGLFDGDDPHKVHDFLVDPNGSIWLDFNVDGVVYHLIDQINSGKKADEV